MSLLKLPDELLHQIGLDLRNIGQSTEGLEHYEELRAFVLACRRTRQAALPVLYLQTSIVLDCHDQLERLVRSSALFPLIVQLRFNAELSGQASAVL